MADISCSASRRSDLARCLLERPVPTTISDDDACDGVAPTYAYGDGVDDDCNAMKDGSIASNGISSKRNRRQRAFDASPLESLPADASSYLLSYLHPHDLFNVALVSKRGYTMYNSELLWQRKFKARWNCVPDPIHTVHAPGRDDSDDMEGGDYAASQNDSFGDGGYWKRSYIAAHCNPHDLWIRHWNCVFPEDVTTCSGRTVIPTVKFEGGTNRWEEWGSLRRKQEGQTDDVESVECNEKMQRDLASPSLHLCPTCRHHPMLQPPGGNDDVWKAVKAEMRYAHEQSQSPTTEEQGEHFPRNSHHRGHHSDPVDTAEVVAAAHALQSSTAKAIHYSTQYSIAKWCRNCDSSENHQTSLLKRFHRDLVQKRARCSKEQHSSQKKNLVQNRAQFAFECASTFDRQIQTEQYQSSGINFLTDALFFNINSSCDKDRASSPSLRSRLGGSSSSSGTSPNLNSPINNDLMHDVFQTLDQSTNIPNNNHSSAGTICALGPNFETSHHTWHVIRLTNPNFILAITFRAYIQSTENFTIYPSEGYIKPGETTHLVLGVRMKGSLTNEVFEQFDIERDDAHPIMPKGSHLPLVPFAIRYMFAPAIVCVPHDYISRPDCTSRSLFTPTRETELVDYPPVVDQLWDGITAEADVRELYVSAHVHSNYNFEEFQNATLTPFDISVNQKPASLSTKPCTALLPNLKHKSSKLFEMMQNLDLEMEDSVAGETYRTEKRCELCERDWGPQSEALGRSYILQKLQVQKMILNLDQQTADFERTMNMIPSLLTRSLQKSSDDSEEFSRPRITRICQLLFCLHINFILQRKADRLVTLQERGLLSAYEDYISKTYADLQTYLSSGKEDHALSEGNLWRKKGISDQNAVCNDGFMGRQDDPNHHGNGQYPPMNTDMFKNDPIKAFVSAVSMISNPEILCGVWDRVNRPGAAVRCPSIPVGVFVRPSQERDKIKLVRRAVNWIEGSPSLLGSSERQCPKDQPYIKCINFEMNEQDPDGLSLITLGQGIQINFQTSLAHFLSNVPQPGVGPLLLPSPKRDANEYDASLQTLYTRVQPYAHMLFPSRSGQRAVASENLEQHTSPRIVNQQNQRNINLDLNILWLIARHLGWFVDDDQNRGSLLVDRRLLIANQWLSNTLMIFSLLASLLSRKFQLITSSPVDIRVGFWQDVYMSLPVLNPIQHVVGLKNRSSRFWSKEECGICAIFVFVFFFILGRSTERHIGRSYELELAEALPPGSRTHRPRSKVARYVSDSFQWWWNISCPLFIQQRLYLSDRNRLTHNDIINQVIHHRSVRETTKSSFSASNGRGRMPVDVANRELGFKGHLVGLAFFVASFSACSPHFVVNSLTVFSCGLSYGMSLSLESMEIVRRTTSTGVLSMIKPRRTNTLVIGYITVGQIVGGSGGIFFLAEFIVTTISLILGGAATLTSTGLENWITFFCLASTAFWGFVFARLGLLDGMRRKRRGTPSALLCASWCSAITMWIVVLTQADWYSLSPGNLIVAQVNGLFSDMRKQRG